MQTALVTGGAGFIGAAVARSLAGYTVQVAGTREQPLSQAGMAELGAFDLIVHCAGSSSVGASWQDPVGDFDSNVVSLLCVLEHVRTHSPGARVVLLSSAAVYGNADQLPTPETARIAPVSPYGAHKHVAEGLCVSWGDSFGVASAIVRLFSVYGPGLRKQLMWDACRKARAGEVTFAGSGNEERDWLHVDDAASLVLAAAAHAAPTPPIFNGGSGIGVRVRDVVGQICRELGAGPPQFSGASRPGDPQRYIADIARARALGWAPRVDVAQGISQYVTWFRDHE